MASNRAYGLYAASNLGSLLALLVYPAVVEPTLTLHAQRSGGAGGYLAFVVLMGLLALAVIRAADRAGRADARPTRRPSPPPPHGANAGLGAAGRHSVESDAGRDQLPDHRRGLRALPLGPPAGALPGDLHLRLPGQAGDPARPDPGAAGRGPRRLRGHPAVHRQHLRARTSHPSGGLLPDGADVPPGAGRPPAPGREAHRVLFLDVGGRCGRRQLQRLCRPSDLRQRLGVSADPGALVPGAALGRLEDRARDVGVADPGSPGRGDEPGPQHLRRPACLREAGDWRDHPDRALPDRGSRLPGHGRDRRFPDPRPGAAVLRRHRRAVRGRATTPPTAPRPTRPGARSSACCGSPRRMSRRWAGRRGC